VGSVIKKFVRYKVKFVGHKMKSFRQLNLRVKVRMKYKVVLNPAAALGNEEERRAFFNAYATSCATNFANLLPSTNYLGVPALNEICPA